MEMQTSTGLGNKVLGQIVPCNFGGVTSLPPFPPQWMSRPICGDRSCSSISGSGAVYRKRSGTTLGSLFLSDPPGKPSGSHLWTPAQG